MNRRLTVTHPYLNTVEPCIVTVPGARGCKDEMVKCKVHLITQVRVAKSRILFWIKPTLLYFTTVKYRALCNGEYVDQSFTTEGHLTLDEVADRVIGALI